jgi:hypothetical protein
MDYAFHVSDPTLGGAAMHYVLLCYECCGDEDRVSLDFVNPGFPTLLL